MRPKDIQVPDRFWMDKLLSEGAKLLWCYLRAVEPTQHEFTYAHLRTATGICHDSLISYLDGLSALGWLTVRYTGLRTVLGMTMFRLSHANLTLPTELVFNRRLPRPAKWIWGAIARAQAPFRYADLRAWTGYSHGTLSKCLSDLYEAGWLQGSTDRGNLKAPFDLQVVNPHARRREAELADLRLGMSRARTPQAGYSLGQFLLARMIKLLVDGCDVFENTEVTGLDNAETGGRMHYDIHIPLYRVALEFHGEQHDRPTELFPNQDEFHRYGRRTAPGMAAHG